MERHLIAALGAVSAVALALPASAQDQAQERTAGAEGTQASQCMQDLRQLAQTLQEDG